MVMDPDPQVLKGLTLLLEDMQFTVISSHHPQQLTDPGIAQADCPDLLILPYELDDGTTGMALAAELRARYKYSIPAILLAHNNDMSHTRFITGDISVLSAQIKPKDLRNTISAILVSKQTL